LFWLGATLNVSERGCFCSATTLPEGLSTSMPICSILKVEREKFLISNSTLVSILESRLDRLSFGKSTDSTPNFRRLAWRIFWMAAHPCLPVMMRVITTKRPMIFFIGQMWGKWKWRVPVMVVKATYGRVKGSK